MASLDTYQSLSVTFPAVFSFLLGVVIFFVIAVVFWMMDSPRIFIEILQLNLSDLDISGKGKVKLDGTDLKIKTVYILALLIIPISTSTVSMSFWNVFLVEEELMGECVPNFDCFPMHHGNYLQRTPVDKCLNIDNCNESGLMDFGGNNSAIVMNETNMCDMAKDITYECYRFVFRYAEGLGAAGGIFLLTIISSKVYFGILVAIITTEGYDYIRTALLIFVWVFAAVLWLLFLIVNTAIPVFREAVFQTNADVIQFAMYVLNFLMIVVSGYIISFGLIKR